MIYTLKDDTECLYFESWWIGHEGDCDTQTHNQSRDLYSEGWHWMPLLWKMMNRPWRRMWYTNPWSITWSILWRMTLNASTLKADELMVKEDAIHKLVINHMIYALKDDTECLCFESWTSNDLNNLNMGEICPNMQGLCTTSMAIP